MSARHAGRFGALLLAALTLGACAGPTPAAAPTTPPAPTPSPTAPVPAAVTLSSGALSLQLQPTAEVAAAGGSVSVTAGADGSATATLAAAGPDALTLGTLAPPAGDILDLLTDGSISVLDASGTWLGGVAPSGVGTSVRTLPDGRVQVSGRTGAALWLSTTAVESMRWGVREGGRSLAVTPTPWARTGSAAAEAGVWAAMGTDPQAATATMRAQLDCHLLGALDKATWNLEPWRPEVDAATMIATACNPT